MPLLTRRAALALPTALPLAALLSGGAITEAATAPDAADQPWPGFPRQDAKLVREVVGASHRSLDRVRELVEARPELAKASWDWGFGDWETPLGAAAHTGRREIAEYLISRGARIDIFAAAMLGMLDVVRAFVAASPGIERTPGPHGIPLIAHARAGDEKAAAVFEYLATLGGSEDTPAPPSPDEIAACSGRFTLEANSAMTLTVAEKKGMLTILATDGFERNLIRLAPLEYHPVGAPGVRIAFLKAGDAVSVLEIREAGNVHRAPRAR